jgi:preprotein translocase subunit Sss1
VSSLAEPLGSSLRASTRGNTWTLRIVAGALFVLGAGSLLLAASAASEHSLAVPTSGQFPDWLAGPLAGVGLPLSIASLAVSHLLLGGAYLVVVRYAEAVPRRWAIGAIVGLHVIFLLAPPLLSSDVFGYLAFARLGAEHGLDPYINAVEQIPGDPVTAYLSSAWPTQYETPYGPLFVLVTYALVPFGIPFGLWALKVLTAAAGLLTVLLVARAAPTFGRPAKSAALFVGLNPLWLMWAVGGAHNDLLMVLFVMFGVCLVAVGRESTGAAALAGAVAIKATAGLALVFAFAGSPNRLRYAMGAVLGGVGVLLIGLLGFGVDVFAYVSNVLTQSAHVSRQNIPERVGVLVGLGGATPGVQLVAAGALLTAIATQLVRVVRGTPWIDAAGWSLAAFLLTTTSLHPWYIAALLPFAALAQSRALRITTLVLTATLALVQLAP